MKVSNGINVTRIYQDSLKKAQAKTNNDDFSKLLVNNNSNENVSINNASALRHSANANLNMAIGSARAEQVNPEEAFKQAVEVFTSPEASTTAEAMTREAKVDRIKALYEAGQYIISAEAIAEKLWASGAMLSWES